MFYNLTKVQSIVFYYELPCMCLFFSLRNTCMCPGFFFKYVETLLFWGMGSLVYMGNLTRCWFPERGRAGGWPCLRAQNGINLLIPANIFVSSFAFVNKDLMFWCQGSSGRENPLAFTLPCFASKCSGLVYLKHVLWFASACKLANATRTGCGVRMYRPNFLEAPKNCIWSYVFFCNSKYLFPTCFLSIGILIISLSLNASEFLVGTAMQYVSFLSCIFSVRYVL